MTEMDPQSVSVVAHGHVDGLYTHITMVSPAICQPARRSDWRVGSVKTRSGSCNKQKECLDIVGVQTDCL